MNLKKINWQSLGRSIDRLVIEIYFIAGILIAAYGVWLFSKPAAYIFSGVVLSALAVIKTYAGRD